MKSKKLLLVVFISTSILNGCSFTGTAPAVISANNAKNVELQESFDIQASKIFNLYDQFNAQLKLLKLGAISTLIDEGKINKALSIINKTDLSVLHKFYSKALVKTDKRCNAAGLCKESNVMFISALSISEEYYVPDIKKISDKSIKLIILGESTITGKDIELGINWLLEDRHWKIDSIVKRIY